LLKRWDGLVGGALHPLLRRGLARSHLGLGEILDCYEQKRPFYVFVSRGPPSTPMHLGHFVPLQLARWMQETMKCPVIIQLSDDEQYFASDALASDSSALPRCYEAARDNARDIVACGFNVEKTFVFSNFEYMPAMYPEVVKLQKLLPIKFVKEVLGAKDTDNCGQVAYAGVRAAPAFAASFARSKVLGPQYAAAQCLVLCAPDEHPFLSMMRELASPKPALLHCQRLPSLLGVHRPIEAADALYLSDAPKVVLSKVFYPFFPYNLMSLSVIGAAGV
jgi:tryptophanyl-tRNA synthetase